MSKSARGLIKDFGAKLEQLEVQRILLGQLPKTFPMILGKTVFSYCFSVFCCGISFVFFPIVCWIFLVILLHIGIAIGFCQYRGGGNGEIFIVPFNDAVILYIGIGFESITVH